MRGYLKTLGWLFKLQPRITTVGRHKDSDLCLQNGGVEDHHAVIELDEHERCFMLRDMNSAHGTYVNKCHIHNASVRLSPGDELHFGYGGPTFELCVDSMPQLSCPLVPKRVAWQTPIQFLEEPRHLCLSTSSVSSQFPHLAPSQVSRIQGELPMGPRPPSRGGRPTSAGATKTKLGFSTEHVVPSRRAVNQTKISGGRDTPGTVEILTSTHTLQHLLQEKALKGIWGLLIACGECHVAPPVSTFPSKKKEEQLLRLSDEVSRLVPFESESHRKDGVIAKLRNQVSTLRQQIMQATPEINLRLLGLEKDISEKNDEIEQLKEQMVVLQKGSSEVLKHSLTERDLKIANLRAQLEKLKKDSSTSAGLMTSLQRDLSTQEKKAHTLAAEVERFRQDVRRKDAQLAAMNSKMKESAKVREELHAREKDVEALQKRVEELQQTRVKIQTALVQQGMEQDTLKVTLDMEQKQRASLGMELEESRQKEQEVLSQLKQSQQQVEMFSRQFIKAISTTQGGSPSQGALSDQQVLHQMTEVIREREALGNKVKQLQEELKEATAEKHKKTAEEEILRNSLEEGQARLREALSAPAIQREIAALKELFVPSRLAWVHTVVLNLLDVQLIYVEEATQALLDSGIDMSDSAEAGIPGGICALRQRQQQCEEELRALQTGLQASQEAQTQSREQHAEELHQRLESLKEEHAKELQEQLESLKEEHAKELQEQLESLKEEHAKELQEQLQSLKELQEQLESLKEDHSKEMLKQLQSLKEEHAQEQQELHEQLESLKEEHAKELQKHLESFKEELEQREQQKLEAQKEEYVKLKVQLEEMRGELELAKTMEATLREQAQTREVEQETRLMEAEQKGAELEKVRWQAREAELEAELVEAKRKGAEIERERWRLLEEEYREQVRQHAHTIVAMEEKLDEFKQNLRNKEKERDSLREQLRDAEKKFEQSKAGKETEVLALKENITALSGALAEARKEVDTQGQVITALGHDLATANATVSNLTEVSEQQKAELEQHRALVVDQRVRLGTLTQKLSQMSRLVDQKGEELQRAREELRLYQEDRQDHISTEGKQEHDHNCAESQAMAKISRSTPELCVHQVAIMGQQQNGQRAEGYRLAATCQHGCPVPVVLCEETLERTARLDLSDTLDLSERTYLELVQALSEALELSEDRLSGRTSLKYLPREEREQVASCRLRDLEVLRGQAQRREEQLHEYQREQHTLRESQVAEQRLQGWVDSLREELQTERQESSLLREALRRTRERLEQEVALNKAIKDRKAVTLDRGLNRIARVVPHSCVQVTLHDKAATRKPRLVEKLKRKEYEAEVLKEQLRKREQELRDATSALGIREEAATPAKVS